MSQKVYAVSDMMTMVLDIRRYIDDGGGFHLRNKEKFDIWLSTVNERINPFGLHIDESNFQINSNYINLLDIQYCFDSEGDLQTDLHTRDRFTELSKLLKCSSKSHLQWQRVFSKPPT